MHFYESDAVIVTWYDLLDKKFSNCSRVGGVSLIDKIKNFHGRNGLYYRNDFLF